MSTVHIINSKEWVPQITKKLERLAAADKEWDEAQARQTEKAIAYIKAENETWTKRVAAFDAKLARWQALSWWERRFAPNPILTDPDAFIVPPWTYYPMMPYPSPFLPLCVALRELLPAAQENMPLDVEASTANLFLGTP